MKDATSSLLARRATLERVSTSSCRISMVASKAGELGGSDNAVELAWRGMNKDPVPYQVREWLLFALPADSWFVTDSR